MNDDEFREAMRAAVTEFGPDEIWTMLRGKVLPNEFFTSRRLQRRGALYKELKSRLEKIDAEYDTAGNRLFYLATAPTSSPGGEALGKANWQNLRSRRHGRGSSSEAFGHDLESARALNRELAKVFDEKQVYRTITTRKETVQNLLVFRFANSIFEPLWNRQYIDHIQITNAETLGVEGRGAYYEKAGALRDIIQNHVFQVTSLIAMEPPASLSANGVRDEKIKAMQSVRAFPMDQIEEFVLRGQYGRARFRRHGGRLSRRAGRRSKFFNGDFCSAQIVF